MTEGTERRVVARVTRVEQLAETLMGRTSIELDAIDADLKGDEIDRALENPEILKPFSSIRIITTDKKFIELFGLLPREGAWVQVELFTRHIQAGPITLLSQLQADGYVNHQRVSILSANYLFDPNETPPQPKSVGASASNASQFAAELVEKCHFPENAIGPNYRVRAVLRLLRNINRIVVRDVGQASFVSFLSNKGVQVAHFDAGWPISYNKRTAPRKSPSVPKHAPVILSHWDWDHLHAFYKCTNLKKVRWLTPVQPLGPGAQKVARQLRNSGLLIGYFGPDMFFGSGALIHCNGRDQNNSGFALALLISSGKFALLVGDADYQELGSLWAGSEYDLLAVTHHGANFAGQPPNPKPGAALAVISVGRANVYKHPRLQALLKHRRAGWRITMTAGNGNRSRSDRYLGP